MSVNEQLQDIQRTLGVHTGKLDAIAQKAGETRENTTKLFAQDAAFGERLARLETKAGFIGAAAGAVVAAAIGIFRWVLDK